MVKTLIVLALLIGLVMWVIYFLYGLYRKIKRENDLDAAQTRDEIMAIREERDALDDLHYEVKRDIKKYKREQRERINE